jgi:hypothetical protein
MTDILLLLILLVLLYQQIAPTAWWHNLRVRLRRLLGL